MSEFASPGGAIVAPRVRDFGELEGQLARWLAERIEGASDLRLENFAYPKGAGQSHETILFDARWRESGEGRSQGLVVRIKPADFPVFVDDMFVEQCEVMRVVHEDGRVPVAKVFWREDDPSVLGSPFFVMERLNGRVAVSNPSYLASGWVAEAGEEQRARLWRQAVSALAGLQKIPRTGFGFLEPVEGVTGFEFEWDRWSRYLDHVDRPDRPLPEHRRVWSALRDRMPANRPAGLVWGDARVGNILVDDNFDVVGLMDWEQPSLGGALHDLGWWLFSQRIKVRTNGGRSLAGIPGREETAALWSEVTGIATADLDWYEAFAGLKTALIAVNLLDLRGKSPQGGGYADNPMMDEIRESFGL